MTRRWLGILAIVGFLLVGQWLYNERSPYSWIWGLPLGVFFFGAVALALIQGIRDARYNRDRKRHLATGHPPPPSPEQRRYDD